MATQRTGIVLVLFLIGILHTSIAVPPYSCNCVVFRLDDIQDYWMTLQMKAVMDTFVEHNLPLTVGIIANEFGEDPDITGYVGNLSRAGLIEVADHGFNHEDFTTFTYDQQLSLLQQASTKLVPIFGSNPPIFIPPFNSFNADTIRALQVQNYTLISSEVDQDPPPYQYVLSDVTTFNNQGQPIWRFPIQPATKIEVVYGSQTLYVGAPYEAVWSQIQSQLANYGFSVVMMHPMEYANIAGSDYDLTTVNGTTLAALVSLLETVNDNHLNVYFMGQLPNHFGDPTATSTTPTSTPTYTPTPVTPSPGTTHPPTTPSPYPTPTPVTPSPGTTHPPTTPSSYPSPSPHPSPYPTPAPQPTPSQNTTEGPSPTPSRHPSPHPSPAPHPTPSRNPSPCPSEAPTQAPHPTQPSFHPSPRPRPTPMPTPTPVTATPHPRPSCSATPAVRCTEHSPPISCYPTNCCPKFYQCDGESSYEPQVQDTPPGTVCKHGELAWPSDCD